MGEIIGTVINVGNFLSPKKQDIRLSNRDTCSLDANRKYIIPDFQREIRWEEEQLIELINNIGDGSKFLGNIILSEKPRELSTSEGKDYEIIDGQQRITTILMILKFIHYRYGDELDLDEQYCPLMVESFSEFETLYNGNFDESIAAKNEIILTDDLNQIPQYMLLWNTIVKYSGDSFARLRNKDTCQSLLENIKKSKLNIIINTSEDTKDGIRFFLDVNLKGRKLDTEDVFKSYLFYQDSGDDIREIWVAIKKLSTKLVVHDRNKEKALYPLMEIVRHCMWCTMYKNNKWRTVEMTENFCLTKKTEVPGNIPSEKETHYRGEHIIHVLKNKSYMKEVLEHVQSFLKMAVDVVESRGPSVEFISLFELNNNNENVNDVTISIAHSFIKKILLDSNLLPKAVLMKYFISILEESQDSKDIYKLIFDVYAFTILFALSTEKKQKELVLSIVAEKKDSVKWDSEIKKAIQTFIQNESLTKAKVVSQYKLTTEEYDEEYMSRGLAVLYNYFSYASSRSPVVNEQKLKNFLYNTDMFSTEHLIVNKSKKYCLTQDEFYTLSGEPGKCCNSMFNFIFISEELNNSLGNTLLRKKYNILQNENIECAYSKLVLEKVNTYFVDDDSQFSGQKFPHLESSCGSEEQISFLDDYFHSDDESDFMVAFLAFSESIITSVYGKLREN